MMHEVLVPCRCDDIEHCIMERYISDVRILIAELEHARQSELGDNGQRIVRKP